MAKYEESHETPKMESEHHSKGFLKKAEKMAPMHKKAEHKMKKHEHKAGRMK